MREYYMTKKAFITGTTGQDGSYLVELLLNKGYEVHGLIRRSSTFNTSRIDHLIEKSDIFGKTFFTHYGDVTDPQSINSLISKIQPNEVYNLAAQSHVKVSFEIPYYTAQVDALGTLNILESVRNHCPSSKVYQASTSEMFGGQVEEIPRFGFSENSPFHPRSPYGCAKVYAYWITKNYREAYNMFTCNGLLFNHESPRRGDTFVTKKITNWVKTWDKDKSIPALRLGNLNSYRDWGHASDYVEAQWLILQQDAPDDYVIATGTTYTVKHFLQECFRYIGKNIEWVGKGLDEKGYCDGKIVIEVDPKYFRPSEVDYLLGDPSKALKKLKWTPKFTFETLVQDMMKNEK
jgi:GDPmannose 4,6-dehydratase